MPADIFGDLREWGQVLRVLDELRTSQALDSHQSGLARLIRCRTNWRLQEEALISAAQIRKPSPVLVEATLGLLKDNDEILESRILAAHALGSMLAASRALPESEVSVDDVMAKMRSLLSDGGPPVFHGAVRKACEQVAAVS